MFGIQYWNIALPYIQHRKQRKGDHAPQRMCHQHGQADPVVTVQPLAIDGTRRRMMMNVGSFHVTTESLRGTVIDCEHPIALRAWIKPFDNHLQHGQRQRRGNPARRYKQFVKAIPIIFYTSSSKPTARSATPPCQQSTSHNDRQPKADTCMQERLHGSYHDPDDSDDNDAPGAVPALPR